MKSIVYGHQALSKQEIYYNRGKTWEPLSNLQIKYAPIGSIVRYSSNKVYNTILFNIDNESEKDKFKTMSANEIERDLVFSGTLLEVYSSFSDAKNGVKSSSNLNDCVEYALVEWDTDNISKNHIMAPYKDAIENSVKYMKWWR